MSAPLLEVSGLVRNYVLPRQGLFSKPDVIRALGGVSFRIDAGRSLGIVGESGSGKSTLARVVMALERPSDGVVRLLGQDLAALTPVQLRRARRDFQMVFQDPYGSLDPRQTVSRIVGEPLDALTPHARSDARQSIIEVLESVGLRAADMAKYPHEFSGGQRQRIALARALVTKPRLIVADEPVSALDVSVQAQVLNLLQDLQARFGVTYLLISHDLAVVEYVCDEVAVMYAGAIVEQGPTLSLLRAPAHPYTRALLDAVPQARPGARTRVAPQPQQLVAASGEAGAHRANATAGGCSFAPRCTFAQLVCLQQTPVLRQVAGDVAQGDHNSIPAAGHLAACHFARQIIALPAAGMH